MKKGDIIYVSVVRKAGFGPRHYGVYDGARGVYHFNGEELSKVYIQYSSLEEFAQGGQIEIDKLYKKRFTPTEIIKRAVREISSTFGGYSLIDNNCEHFATWCVTGEKQSRQTDLDLEVSTSSVIKIVKEFFAESER